MNKYTPYLQLGDRLTQIWINKYTLILLLAFLKLLFFYFSIGNELNLSKQYILNHCHTIDSFYNNIKTNTPYYLGIMGNYLIDKTIKETVRATLTLLSLLVYASEELMTFVIDLYLGTYACLIVSAIDGTVDVATNTTEKLLGAVNNTVYDFANDLDDGLDDISKVINKVLNAASKVENFFTDDDDDDDSNSATNKINKVNLTISALRNVHIPSSINDKLEELSAKTPDFATVKNDTKKLIAIPFDKIRKEIKAVNTSRIIGNGTNLLYVPPKDESTSSNLKGICSSNTPTIEKMYVDMGKTLKMVTVILMVILMVGAIIVMILEAWKEVKQWSKLKQLQQNCSLDECDQYSYFTSEEEEVIGNYNIKSLKTKSSEESDKQGQDYYEPMDIIENYQRTFQVWQSRISDCVVYILTLGRNCSVLQKRKIQWFASYITSERALFVLAIGLLGILVSGFQLIILAFLKKQIHNAHQLQSRLFNSSEMDIMKKDLTTWTTHTNAYINSTETNINTQIFGWVETSTTSINNTVTTMIKDIDTTLADIFNGTLLYHPMTTVVKCVIEDKLYAVEKAMTWIHNKAQVSLPQINPTEIINLVKNTNTTNSSSASTPEAIMQNFIKEIHTMLTTIVKGFHRSVILELIISCAITSIWAIQIPIALLILLCKQ